MRRSWGSDALRCASSTRKSVGRQEKWDSRIVTSLRPSCPKTRTTPVDHARSGRGLVRQSVDHGLVSLPDFSVRARVGRIVTSFPTPATSNAACGSPALRSPAHFLPRVMRLIDLVPLSSMAHCTEPSALRRERGPHRAISYSTASNRRLDTFGSAKSFSLRLDVYPSSQFLQFDGCFYHLTPASH